VILDWELERPSGDRLYERLSASQYPVNEIALAKTAAHNVSSTHADVDHDRFGTSLSTNRYDSSSLDSTAYQNTRRFPPGRSSRPRRSMDSNARYRQLGRISLFLRDRFVRSEACATGARPGYSRSPFLAFAPASARARPARAMLLAIRAAASAGTRLSPG